MPNLTTQEAAALCTKINGPFPNILPDDELLEAFDGVGSPATAGVEGGNAFFVEDGGLYDAYCYVSHQ